MTLRHDTKHLFTLCSIIWRCGGPHMMARHRGGRSRSDRKLRQKRRPAAKDFKTHWTKPPLLRQRASQCRGTHSTVDTVDSSNKHDGGITQPMMRPDLGRASVWSYGGQWPALISRRNKERWPLWAPPPLQKCPSRTGDWCPGEIFVGGGWGGGWVVTLGCSGAGVGRWARRREAGFSCES